MAQHSRSAGFATSLIVGMLLIPVSAFAAYAIVSSGGPEEPPSTVAMTIADTTTSTIAETTTTAVDTIVVEPVTASDSDLERACGEDGLVLVAAEADGTITEVQQAALDALRQVCAESGLELAGPPAPEPIVRTVTVQASSGGTTTSYIDDHGQYQDDDHDEYEDDDHDEYEDDDDEYEDHDDEDDDDHEDDD